MRTRFPNSSIDQSTRAPRVLNSVSCLCGLALYSPELCGGPKLGLGQSGLSERRGILSGVFGS